MSMWAIIEQSSQLMFHSHLPRPAWKLSRIQANSEGTQVSVASISQKFHLEGCWAIAIIALIVLLLASCHTAATSTPRATIAANTPVPAGEATSIPATTPAKRTSTKQARPPTVVTTRRPRTAEGNDVSMGGTALGGNAETTLIAQQAIIDLPDADPVWVAHEGNIAFGEEVIHSHEFAFVYAVSGTHFLIGRSEVWQILPGEGVSIFHDLPHRHGATAGDSTFWEVRLAESEGSSLEITPEFRLVFESEPLQDVPPDPQAVFVLVRLPQGGQTSVHTHPGPELIYQLTGQINYENAIIGVKQMGPGDVEGIPPGTAVQKRNPFDEVAEFLSWFLVDTTQPFASAAQFAPSAIDSANLALLGSGTRVVAVSSNFGGGGVDSAYGASKALDGNPSTEWSSDGDGDDAWIEIDLPARANITSIGIWTRTMGSSAQISSFRVVNDLGEIVGPFTLANATEIHHFDTDIEASRLRFEVIDSSGGNTGVVEIQVFGEPLP